MALGSTADIDYMLKDAGGPVTIGSDSGYGILDESNSELSMQGVGYGKRVTTLLVRTGKFTLTTGQTVTARRAYSATDVAFRLDDWSLQDDGALTLMELSRTTP